jgi:hypothetical protein
MFCSCPCRRRTPFPPPPSTTCHFLPLRHRVPTRPSSALVRTPFLAGLSGFQCSGAKTKLLSPLSKREFSSSALISKAVANAMVLVKNHMAKFDAEILRTDLTIDKEEQEALVDSAYDTAHFFVAQYDFFALAKSDDNASPMLCNIFSASCNKLVRVITPGTTGRRLQPKIPDTMGLPQLHKTGAHTPRIRRRLYL